MTTKKSMFAAERRNSMEILMSILEESKSGINKTRLVYRTNLNFLVIRKYIDFLVKKELLNVEQKDNIVYTTTEKGHQVLEEFNRVKEMMGIEQVIEYKTYL
jgi:predicted transcriptional regulator